MSDETPEIAPAVSVSVEPSTPANATSFNSPVDASVERTDSPGRSMATSSPAARANDATTNTATAPRTNRSRSIQPRLASLAPSTTGREDFRPRAW